MHGRSGRSFSSQNGLVFFSHGNGSPSESDARYPATFVLWLDRRCRTRITNRRPFKTMKTIPVGFKSEGRNPKAERNPKPEARNRAYATEVSPSGMNQIRISGADCKAHETDDGTTIFLPLFHRMEERDGERRRVFTWISPLLTPLPTPASRGEEGSKLRERERPDVAARTLELERLSK